MNYKYLAGHVQKVIPRSELCATREIMIAPMTEITTSEGGGQTMTNNQLTENSVTQLLNSVKLARDNAERDDNRVDHSFYYALARALEELQERRNAERDSEPVAIVEPSDYVTAAQLVGEGPARKAVHELYEGALRIGDKLYRHAQPALVPDKMTYQDGVLFVLNNDMSSIERGTVAMRAWNACRAAMLQELQKSARASNNCRSNEKVQAVQVQPLPGINPAPALGSLPKRGEVLPTNSPVIPDGYVMVPKLVTPEIGNAINEVGHRCTCGNCSQRLWDLLLASAQQEVKGE